MVTRADVGVIGGSGFYSLLDDATEVELSTPYGPPSDVITVGRVGSRSVAFIPRHGRDHRFPPHRIPYRANLWALRSLGVRQVLAPSAVGSLRPELGPGALVVPDQIVDRTSGRVQTYYDAGGVVHVSFADPYCPSGRAAAVSAAESAGWSVADGGTLVVIEGPRFSTRAESRWFTANGWTIVGMTGFPESVLARELAMCYTSLSLVTDHDAGVEAGEGVTHEEVLAFFSANVTRMRSLVTDLIVGLPQERTCPCGQTLDGLKLPFELPR
ncbi:purine nucleoside phosphorylase [Planobispora rosea]|uniref:Purine nucleoside phosphorylase n=1 Tax=Planobispora rosea TaxID=35762 RepID=A0A8J3WG82_PLARO|nr:S-methyl-5'-thioadenosine phosphorylase [Planobispora rosea]GGT00760.1 purine nucleoside phosphorylase [Planobispora rosea]GIH88158.1 purine nucleoside phosphorylase [Planobispora rosea]